MNLSPCHAGEAEFFFSAAGSWTSHLPYTQEKTDSMLHTGGTTCVPMLSDLLYMAFASYRYEKQWIQQKNNEILSNEMDFHTDFNKQARLLQGSANKSVVCVCHLTLCRDVLECQDALTRYLLLQEQLPNITSCCCAVSQMQVLSRCAGWYWAAADLACPSGQGPH